LVDAALNGEGGLCRVVPDGEPHQVDSPQGAGECVGAGARPQFGEGVDAVNVGELDEAVDDVVFGVGADAGDKQGGGVVGNAAHLGRIFCSLEVVEGVTREPGGLVEVTAHAPEPSSAPCTATG